MDRNTMKTNQRKGGSFLRSAVSWLVTASIALGLCLTPLSVLSVEQSETESNSVQIGFDTAVDGEKFDLYQSSAGGFAVENGKLSPSGTPGEFKAIYKADGRKIRSVSVELHPVGNDGPIFGGLYINASNAGHNQDQVDGLYVGIESHFTGWSDAKNRIDVVTGSFPAWKELKRMISETGAGNNLFSGVKQPILLKVALDGNQLTATVSLVSDPSKSVSYSYVYQGAAELGWGSVGIRSQFNNACYDNFVVEYADERLPQQNEETVTRTLQFENAADADSFGLYSSSAGGFTVANGKLTPAGAGGEFKAVYEKEENAVLRAVSVEIYPGASGKLAGGLYISAGNPAQAVDQINALNVNVESNHSGWSDAPNRIDLVLGSFPAWTELKRVISETGAGNNLFSGGVKKPLKLTVEITGNRLDITLCLLENPGKSIGYSYVYQGAGELGLGDVGIRSPFSDATYDNFTVTYTVPEQTEPEQTEPEETEPEETEPEETEPEETEPEIVPTDLVDFETAESSEKFRFYHSSSGGFAVQDGRLIPTGEPGEFKAVYLDTNASFDYVSVDIYPGENGINGGLYLDLTDVGHPVDQANGLYIGIESDFPHGTEPDWEDAPNRLDLVVGKFPVWQELHREVSETGAGNNLYSGGVKEPINLSVSIDGNQLMIRVRLLSDPSRFISTVYTYEQGQDIALGNVGIRGAFTQASFDNFAVCYTQVEADKEPDVELPEFTPTQVLTFDSAEDAQQFDFYHSSSGGLAVEDGKLVPTGETGEFKAIYRDGGNAIEAVSVDIYPGESGQINSGIYIGTSTVENGADRIKGLVVMVESNHSGWDDAVNRIDLVVGRFPIWKELHRYTSETGSGNALFAGAKEPLKLTVFLNGNELTVVLSLLNQPDRFVSTVYTYNGATRLSAHNVGLRSPFSDSSFDNFAVRAGEGGGSADRVDSPAAGDTGSTGNTGGSGQTNGTPDTGDSFRPEIFLAMMVISAGALVALGWNYKSGK